MSDYDNRETAADRAARKERAQLITSGARNPVTGLTDAEADLLARLYAAVEHALATGDLITVRVFYDNGAELMRLIHGRKPGGASFTGPDFDKLRVRCDEALLTPEGKKARKDILRLEATRIRLHQVKNATERRLKNVRIEVQSGKPKLADGDELARRAMFRSSF